MILEGHGYSIERRWRTEAKALAGGSGVAQVRLVIEGRPLVQAAGLECEHGRIMHLLMGVLGREGVKEALLEGPAVPDMEGSRAERWRDPKKIRCPACQDTFPGFDAAEDGDGVLRDGEQEVYCPECDHHFTVEVEVRWEFTSPPLEADCG